MICYKNSPATVADNRLASVPPTSALIPSLASSDLLSGARAPIPPIWIPIDIKFAKPQSAKVARNTDLWLNPFD